MQPPVPIKFTPQIHYSYPVTRSKALDQPSITTASRFQVGRVYVVLSDADQEGYAIVKCISVNSDSIDAYLLTMGRFKNVS